MEVQNFSTKAWRCKILVRRLGGAKFWYLNVEVQNFSTKTWRCKILVLKRGGAKF